MLIANAELHRVGLADLRIEQGRIAAIGQFAQRPGEPVLDQQGAAVLPGLNDHHLHLMAYAASLDSVACGPPSVTTEAALAEALRSARPNAQGWIRGIGYHESVAGPIDSRWLDRLLPGLPVRVQHRSGRLWTVSETGLDWLREAAADGRLPIGAQGRFFDQDAALGALWGQAPPPIEAASRQLAAWGVTGVTDLTPANDTAVAARFAAHRAAGHLLQRILVGGTLDLDHETAGPLKVHLHESSLPDFNGLCRLISAGHAKRRAVAVHCVTETELVFTLAAFEQAGVRPGDRIEHASVAPPAVLDTLRDLGLLVVTQPHFVAERGDAYLRDLPAEERPWLYRCRSFRERRIPLAGGSDAPFGHADPWRSMRAAVDRRTASGQTLGADEALTAEQALSLYLGALDEPGRERRIEVGAVADLCLLDSPWRRARRRLESSAVAATIQEGRIIYRRD